MTTKAAKDHQSVPVGIIWKKKKKKKETNGWDGSCGSCRFAANQFPAFSLDRQLMITSDRFQLRRLNATPDEISSFIEYRGQVSTGEGGRSKDFRGGKRSRDRLDLHDNRLQKCFIWISGFGRESIAVQQQAKRKNRYRLTKNGAPNVNIQLNAR